jgi:hypothetical protein
MNKTAKYNLALQVVGRVIHEWDPYSLLESGCPNDEFDAEIASVVAQVSRIKSAEDAAYALSRVFSSAFEPDKFKPNDCREAGSKLFQALASHGLLPDDVEGR